MSDGPEDLTPEERARAARELGLKIGRNHSKRSITEIHGDRMANLPITAAELATLFTACIGMRRSLSEEIPLRKLKAMMAVDPKDAGLDKIQALTVLAEDFRRLAELLIAFRNTEFPFPPEDLEPSNVVSEPWKGSPNK